MPSPEAIVNAAELNEKCAVFAANIPDTESAARIVTTGLFRLQHRGQEGSGVVSSDGESLYHRRGRGLVTQVFDPEDFDIAKLPGSIAIGHNRYSTSNGNGNTLHYQPIIGNETPFALAHNGNIPDTSRLEAFLDSRGVSSKNMNDSEMMHTAIEQYVKCGAPLEEAVREVTPLFTGAYSLVLMDKDKVVALRDPKGVRPLSLAGYKNGYLVASETCAFTQDMRHIRDIKPGEEVVIDKNGFTSQQFAEGEQKLDIFEFVYFSRPDSHLLGKSVYKVRERFGEMLAEEFPRIKGDIVIDVPNSGLPAAHGFARASGIPKEVGLIKNTYSGRTFIDPGENIRAQKVREKLTPLPEVLAGQRVIVVDDSIVRGTTPREVVKMIRDAGAIEVHMLITSSPVKYPDFYGIDTPQQSKLLAARMSIDEMKQYISADSLHFLPYSRMIEATGLPEDAFSTSAFTGNYPIDIGRKKSEVIRI